MVASMLNNEIFCLTETSKCIIFFQFTIRQYSPCIKLHQHNLRRCPIIAKIYTNKSSPSTVEVEHGLHLTITPGDRTNCSYFRFSGNVLHITVYC